MSSFKEKIVFVTGASSGIGRATALAFAEAGAKLLLCARRSEKLKDLEQEILRQFGVQTFSFTLDVSNKEQIDISWSKLPEEWKNIDILINNAGLAAGRDKAQDASWEDWEQMIDTNIKGLIYITKKVLPQMIEKKSGHIINIGSIAGHEPYAFGSVYCATKAAVRSFSRALKMDLLGTAVRVTSIDPGMVETEFSIVRFKGDTTKAKDVYQGMEPLKAEDIAECILFAANRPKNVNISEMLILANDQGGSTQVNRR